MHKKKAIYIVTGVLVLFITILIVRSVILNNIISKISGKLEQKYNLELTIGDKGFKGIKSVEFQNILIKKSQSGDTLFYSGKLFFQLRFWNLLAKKVRFRKIFIENTELNLNNILIDSVIHIYISDTTKIDKNTETNYAARVNRIFNVLFSYVPNEIKINNLQFNYTRGKIGYKANCSEFTLQNNAYNGSVQFSDSALNSTCLINGEIDRSAKNFYIAFKGNNSKPVEIPFVSRRWGLDLKFDSIVFGFNQINRSSDHFRFGGFIETRNLYVNNKRLAPKPVFTEYGSCNFTATAEKTNIEMDSTSTVTINKFTFSPYFLFEKNQNQKISFRIIPKVFEASEMFESFPEGLFTSIRDMQVRGKLEYSLDSWIYLNCPDSIKINSTLKNKGLQIMHYGAVPFTLLNDTFEHRIIEKDGTEKTILISPENPDYAGLNEISEYLKNSVLTSEDGSFFYHKGFNEESIEKSFSENIKQRRFARGGSTITMQLVKNIFLTQNKTISRKLEELLIVWMIENMHIVSKERMFEVYLNIIEWGPGVYGIKPAAEFYFKKKPSQLTLSESIYLSSIIPAPKFFKYTFTKEGKLKSFYSDYYNLLTTFMLSRNQISTEDTVGLVPEIVLTGIAKDMLQEPDTFKIDSMSIENPAIIQELFNPEEDE